MFLREDSYRKISGMLISAIVVGHQLNASNAKQDKGIRE